MSFMLDPRGDLPPPTIQPSSFYYTHYHKRATSYGLPAKKPKSKQCYDWIFSTASNVHIAIDRAAFKTYVPFKSYVLTVSDQRQVPVRGIGTVELKLRREPGSRENHTIVLENVLHVPDWLCNVISDIYFVPASHYEHTWTELGVNFFVRDKDIFKPWGYTENFCGLDRLVLSKNHQGRSPMLEDPDREVFSVSLTWPQSQKDKGDNIAAEEMKQDAKRVKKAFEKKHAEDEAKGLKREVKSNLESTKSKLIPDAIKRPPKQNSSESGEIIGELEILPRGSRRMFDRFRL
ncbi:uncharacterized protein Z519_06719 [Cladophialophora bantiana CBS 173.52]|uniref:Retrovirus-related Pol polyprotein from transposon TNT 1-94-like beta-barrel domain-containing protein n=1 Tax=Cladophialophora bantiana (strain ATCC 10958 / CBS 173.52 / CDC B-1940 / NIH 8579) TaxID=1442370 RepID=A0A0D2HPU5_CLAB1|nr:uncharacterized protein Z519_06719 [Cladophialophora bantiana CBS 173.52]KIW92870.1 hypothetical protein Z519_06719 [Cladophialophora bantiana CBS 173.52]